MPKKQKFSLQANRKTHKGADNPDRDAQFHVINDAVKAAIAESQPAISVDAKKKELAVAPGLLPPGPSPGVAMTRRVGLIENALGKCENRFEEIGHVARRLLAPFRIASHGDAAFGATLQLGCGLCAPRDLAAARLRGEDAIVQINLALTIV